MPKPLSVRTAFIKTASYFSSGILTGVLCSSFVAEITKEDRVKFKEFYKAPSFYLIAALIALEFIKNTAVSYIFRKDNETKQLKHRITELQDTVASLEAKKEERLSEPELEEEKNTNHSEATEEIEQTIYYANKKIIQAASSRMSVLIEHGEIGEEFNKLQEVLDRLNDKIGW